MTALQSTRSHSEAVGLPARAELHRRKGEMSARAGQCTDAEIVRFYKRVPLFVRRGIAPDQADAMAWSCLERDADKSDLHFCAECTHLQQSGHCFAAKQGWLPTATHRMEPVRDVLTRCLQFKWQVC